MQKDRKITKEKVKNFLLKNRIFHAVLIIILGYLILAPFLPEINYQIRKALGIRYREEEIFVYEPDTVTDPVDIQTDEDDETERLKRKYEYEPVTGNRIVIPTIGVYIGIVEGNDDSVLFRGAWRRPNSSTPDKGGNTVITGHRFHYVPPNNKTFYNLNKIEKESKVFVLWGEDEYIYQVYDIFIVEADQTEIEDNTNEDILTLYTCHPLWTADKRLVVRANLIDILDTNE